MRTVEGILEYLEENINEQHLDAVVIKHKKALNYEPIDTLPAKISVDCGIARKSMDEIHGSPEAMMFNELLGCVNTVRNKDDSLPMIRANYGVGTFVSLFGLKSSIVNGNMPWVTHLGDIKQVEELIERGVPDLDNGFGKKLTETHGYYRSMLSKYPKCNRSIKVYHPDGQGPFDNAHLIWGGDIYIELYDNPDLVHKLMSLVTDTYIKQMERNLAETNAEIEGGYNCHWQMLYKGRLVLRDDSSVNLSRDMYLEFVKPYNQRIANHFGSVSMHFCGRADQWIKELINTERIDSVNFGWMYGKFNNEFLKLISKDCFENKVSVVAYPADMAEFDASIFPTGMTIAV